MQLTSRTLLLALFPALACAGEYTVQPAPFETAVPLDAVLLPETVHAFAIDPKAWTEFKILDLKEQGAPVKKGEAVVTLDTEAIDRQIADAVDGAKLRKMALANAERELADLEKSTAWKLAAAERAYQRAKEDYTYFKEVERQLAEEAAKHSLDRAERGLEYQEEELAQLLKMYQEDDLTEETEEIILKRQRNSVESARFALKLARVNHERTLETDLPRKAADWEDSMRNAELAWGTAQETLPRALEQKRLEVKKAREADERADEKEAEVRSDRELMDLVSPVDGRVYHGEISDGQWSAATAAKFMKPGGLLPARTVFATVIPDETTLYASGFVGEESVARLEKGQNGRLTPASAPRERLAVTVREVSRYPNVEGKYRVELKPVVVPKDLNLVAGMKGKVKVIAYRSENALAVPAKALEEEPDGSFSVQVKLADGNSEKRRITVGAESGDMVEVLEGLEAGQVVMVGNGNGEEQK